MAESELIALVLLIEWWPGRPWSSITPSLPHHSFAADVWLPMPLSSVGRGKRLLIVGSLVPNPVETIGLDGSVFLSLKLVELY